MVFLHALKEGAADRSFGLQVAAMAGLPQPVLHHARQRLNMLERPNDAIAPSACLAKRNESTTSHHDCRCQPQPALEGDPYQPGLFNPETAALRGAIAQLDLDSMTPKQALETLYQLRALL